MPKSAKSKAEQLFSFSRKEADHALKEKEKVRQQKAEHVAKLKALRLAKEAADKDAAAGAAADKAAKRK